MLRQPADRLRVLLWYADVRASFDGASNYRLGKEFSESPGAWRQWQRYEKGEAVPQRETVTRVDARYPNVSRWLRLPLWDTFRDSTPLATLVALIPSDKRYLAKELTDQIEKTGRTRSYSERSLRGIDSLWRQGDINAFTALLALARLAEQANDKARQADICFAAMHVFFLLAMEGPFFSVRHELFRHLKEQFFSRCCVGGVSVLRSEKIRLDKEIEGLRCAIAAAERFGIAATTPKEQARLAYWIRRSGMPVDIVYVWSVSEIVRLSYFRDFLIEIGERIRTEERRNPKRSAYLFRYSLALLRAEMSRRNGK